MSRAPFVAAFRSTTGDKPSMLRELNAAFDKAKKAHRAKSPTIDQIEAALVGAFKGVAGVNDVTTMRSIGSKRRGVVLTLNDGKEIDIEITK
jgi:hypothetical protein